MPPFCCRRWDALRVDAFVQWWFPVLLSGSRWSPCSEMSPGHGPTGRGKSTQLSLASELVLSGKAGEQDKESDFTKALPHPPAASVRACWLKLHHPGRLQTPRERVCWAVPAHSCSQQYGSCLMLHYYGCTVSMKGFYFFHGHLSLQVSLCFP